MINKQNPLITFLSMAIAAVLVVLGLIVSFYLFIFGALAGLVLLAIAYLRNRFGKKKDSDYIIIETHEQSSQTRSSGRTIDHSDS